MLILLLLSALCAGLSSAQIIYNGQCDSTIPVETNFNLTRWQGNWRLISSYENERQSGTCNQANYELVLSNVLAVVNSHVVNQTLATASGSATLPSTDAKLTVNIGTNPTIEFWILSTDYDSYSLAYSCDNINSTHQNVWSWKLSRTTTLSAAANQSIDQVIANTTVLDNFNFQDANQSDAACFYYPDLLPNEPVVFPGQCNPNITVVNNFNITAYQGSWNLISSYYSERQSGSCNRAQYTQNGNQLNLVNSHVVNQTLLSTSGTATPIGTAGRLRINIGTNPEVEFLILDTDYDSYALAYSCENINSEEQRIWSWKLSRTTTLSSQATQNINSVMSSVDVLDARYFQDADQSDAACFFYPDLLPNEPVVFPGQCNPNITVVSNFNITAYQGSWNLISTYYSERQSGSCNRAQYAQSGNLLNLVNSHVANQTLLSTSGTATPIGNNGKLRVNIGTNPEVEFWILATDYNSYALAYSCENINSQQQRIWSWKMSRTRSLSSQATQNINAVINSVNVLDERYFQDADQSDAACFYYPVLLPNEPVVFPGQCNPNITVVNNFNTTAYQGSWNLISSYYSERQSGSCNRAQYTQIGNVLNLVNSHVVNQTLLSTSGTATVTGSNGKLTVNIGTNPQVEFWVLDTDYDSYALAYSCENINSDQQRIWSWKLSRTRSLSNQATQNINAAINSVNVLDARYFQDADQSDAACFYYPNLLPNEPVVFPGQCNPNITVVSNFNLTAYQGNWNLISSYYSERQSGSCNRAQYTQNGNQLSLVNSHVVNATLLSTSGTATPIGTDGKLTVNIGTNPQVEFWILNTDYNSYALAYSCENINNEQQRIWSWKLSRTTTLSSQATQSINSVMSSVDVLDERYFQDADQSDAACFYFPDIQPNEPVILSGQCNPNISVVNNFNATRYLGTWHLISSYYAERQSGSCNRVQYTQNGNILDLVNSHVVNQTLVSTSGTATPISSGKLQINIGTNPVVEFWILDTDYDNYALGYSCENVNSEQQRIWSWKMSRASSLTSQANENINRIIDSVSVLDNRFFQNADQSDAACFYLPDIPLGEAVVFPGQCDTNISVVTNFDINAFLGDWRLISTYYTHRQSGTCNTARYYNNGTTYRVTNMHVNNQSLGSVSGTVNIVANGTGKLTVAISSRTVDYWILATDYSGYALAYTCSNLADNQRRVYSWKLSRTRSLSATANNAIDRVINEVDVLNERYYENANQSDAACFYFPDPHPDTPVTFPGQCDTNIQAVSNFNMTAFQGMWHEIEIYPTGLNNEQCASQQYTQTSATTMTLAATFVQNELQLSNNWSFVLNSTDNSGLFMVTIQTSAMTITFPYWILSTDYSDFAYAYGCVNVDADHKRVYSWKLSRTKQLSSAANTAINSVSSNIQVLDERYFKAVNHSEAACFHLPEFAEGSTIVLPGQCDVNIPVVQDFDVEKYSGTWYQIERYPQRYESGSCTGARYTLSDGGVTVLNWQQIDNVLDTIEGTATINSTDGSARLLVNLPVQGSDASNPQTSSMLLYVLNTDYESYSLAYSCVNVDAHYRAIGAWKLSRTRSMPAAGNNAINAYMAGRQELQAQYFITVEQDDSCPEPSSASFINSSLTLLFLLFVALRNLA